MVWTETKSAITTVNPRAGTQPVFTSAKKERHMAMIGSDHMVWTKMYQKKLATVNPRDSNQPVFKSVKNH